MRFYRDNEGLALASNEDIKEILIFTGPELRATSDLLGHVFFLKEKNWVSEKIGVDH